MAGEGEELDILPFNHCAPVHVEARLIDVGYATSGELRRAGGAIAKLIALLDLAFEPFTPGAAAHLHEEIDSFDFEVA